MPFNRSHSDNRWWEIPRNTIRTYNTIIQVSLSHFAGVRNERKLIPQQRHPYLVIVLSPHHYSITSGEAATDRLIQSTLTAT